MGILSSIGRAIGEAIANSEGARRHREARAAMAPAEAAAHTICKAFGYAVSTLELQKILYVCEREHLGATGKSLIGQLEFHATDFGPLVRPLHKRLNAYYGIKPIPRSYFGDDVVLQGSAADLVNAACAAIKRHPSWGTPRGGGLLVSMTHRTGGAWANAYHPGLEVPIRKSDIRAEQAEIDRERRKPAEPHSDAHEGAAA